MIFLILGMLCLIIFLVIYFIGKYKFNRLKKEYTDTYTEYLGDINNNCGMSFSNWCRYTKNINFRYFDPVREKEFYKISNTAIGWFYFGIMFIVISITILTICNIDNNITRNYAIEKSAMYQEYVDNVKDTISIDGYESVNNWNNTIIECRNNQEHWLLSSHYIICDDWDDVPLVAYNIKEKKTEIN